MAITVTARGMVTSVGFDAPSSCAAIRAGLARPHPLEYFQALDLETNELTQVVGHPVRGFTDGFNLVGRWLRLAYGAVDALADSVPPPGDAAFWSRTGLLVVVPPVDTARFQNEDEKDPAAAIRDSFIAPLLRRLKAPLDAKLVDVGGLGPAGLGTTLRLASDWLSRSVADRVLVVAVDSMLDPLTLQWLARTQRLKTEELAVGLMPGEAAVALLVEADAAARRRNARVWGRISSFATAKEPNAFAEGKQNSGRGLAQAVREVVLTFTPKGTAFIGDLYSDHNGESWRALEWGTAAHRLAGVAAPSRMHLPATSLGDVGAASGPVAVCCALHDHWRRFSKAPTSLVVSSSDTGEVTAIAVTRPD